jgi:hypothetical protein
MEQTLVNYVVAALLIAWGVITIVRKFLLEPIAQKKKQEETPATEKPAVRQLSRRALRQAPDADRMARAREALKDKATVQLLYSEEELITLETIAACFNLSSYAHVMNMTAEVSTTQMGDKYRVMIMSETPVDFYRLYMTKAFPEISNQVKVLHFIPGGEDYDGGLEFVLGWLRQRGAEEAFSVR